MTSSRYRRPGSPMIDQAAVGIEHRVGGIPELACGLPVGIDPTCPVDLAPLTFLVGVDERATGEGVEQSTQDAGDLGRGHGGAYDALTTAAGGRQIIAARADARRGIEPPQELGGRERVERVLEELASLERARELIVPEAARLVVDHLVG